MTQASIKILSKAVILITAVLLCLGGCSALSSQSAGGGGESSYADSFFYIKETAKDNQISVSAHSAILMEADSGAVLWSKDANRKMPMASTTKIMTALVVLENARLDDVVVVSPNAVGIEGSSIYLFANERISVEDLLYALLLSSANDAAAALAIEIGGSIEGFADMMNAKAAELELSSTHFTNPHGLDDEQHYTTARELAIIAREAMKNQTFAKIVSTYKKTASLDGEGGIRLFVNHNKLLKKYEGACGIKTGFTKKCGRCLVSCAERDGVRLLCVTLNAPNDWNDHKTLFDHGFSVCQAKMLCDEGAFELSLPVVGGEQSNVTVGNASKVTLTTTCADVNAECIVELSRFAYAPVKEGDVMGRLVYYLDGKKVAECPIVAKHSVERKIYKKSFFDWIFG